MEYKGRNDYYYIDIQDNVNSHKMYQNIDLLNWNKNESLIRNAESLK